MPSHKKKYIKYAKEDKDLSFKIILKNFKKNSAGDITAVNTNESSPTLIDESKFINLLNKSVNPDAFLFPNTLWVSDDFKSFLVYEDPGNKMITVSNGYEFLSDIAYYHPAIIYYISFVQDIAHVMGLWYVYNVNSIYDLTNEIQLRLPYLLNVFPNGLVCPHNFYDSFYEPQGSISLSVNSAIEEFWSSIFNTEVNTLFNTNLLKTFTAEKYNEDGEPIDDEDSVYQNIKDFFLGISMLEEENIPTYLKIFAYQSLSCFNKISDLAAYINETAPSVQAINETPSLSSTYLSKMVTNTILEHSFSSQLI